MSHDHDFMPDPETAANPRYGQYYEMALSLSQSGELHLALDTIDRAVSRGGSHSPHVQHSRAVVLMQLERFSQAADQFRDVLTIAPDHNAARFGLGAALIELGEFEQAIPILEPLMTSTLAGKAANSLGVACFYSEQIVKSIQYLTTAVVLNPASPAAQTLQGMSRDIGNVLRRCGIHDDTSLVISQLETIRG